MLKFHPYSILTGDTRVEFVIYCVLRSYCPNIYTVLKGLILELVLTKPEKGYFGMFMKKARRKEFDLAILNMAALVKITDHDDKDDTIIEDIKIAFGGSSQLLEYSGVHNDK